MISKKKVVRINGATITIDLSSTNEQIVYDMAGSAVGRHFQETLTSMRIRKQYRDQIYKTLDGQTVSPQDLALCLASAYSDKPIY